MVTLFLFWGMQYLIAIGADKKNNSIRGEKVEIGVVQKAQAVEKKVTKPKRPEDTSKPPETLDLNMDTHINSVSTGIVIGIAPVQAAVKVGGSGGFSASDGDYLPIVKVAPMYPRRAQERGLSGYVILSFTVTKLGTVANVKVVETSNSIFNRAAIKAALKFKYKPRVVDGDPISVAGVLNKITFEMEKKQRR